MTALGANERATLLAIARASVESGIRRPFDSPGGSDPRPSAALPDENSVLARRGASFVTITVDGMLRGCVGTLEPGRPLAEDVAINARAAAFEDSRFADLSAEELGQMKIEISVLSASEEIEAHDREGLLAALRPGVDGVVVESGLHRATFLPQVWRSLPEPDAFVGELAKKAGLPRAIGPPDAVFRRYSVESWSET